MTNHLQTKDDKNLVEEIIDNAVRPLDNPEGDDEETVGVDPRNGSDIGNEGIIKGNRPVRND